MENMLQAMADLPGGQQKQQAGSEQGHGGRLQLKRLMGCEKDDGQRQHRQTGFEQLGIGKLLPFIQVHDFLAQLSAGH